MKIIKNILISGILFLLTLLIVGKNLDKPFYGIHDWNGARYGNIARNYLRYGIFTLGFSQVENGGLVSSGEFKYLTHYPPLLPILISLSYRLFGISEWATRLVTLIASAGTIVSLYLIGRTIFTEKEGIMVSLLALATPMVRYFGKNPVHEPLALFFASCAFLGAILIAKKRSKGWVLVWSGLVLSLLTNWLGVFLLASLTVLLFKEVEKKRLLAFYIVSSLILVGHFIQTRYLTGSFLGGGLGEAFLQRTALGGASEVTPFNFVEFLDRVRLWVFTNFSASLTLASLAGVYLLARKIDRRLMLVFTSLLIYGLGQPLVFPNATFIHSYFIYPMLLFLVITSGYAIKAISSKYKFPSLVIFLLIFLAVWFERASYLKTLSLSQNDSLGVEIGKEIASKTSQEDTILVVPFSFGASRMPHLSFYSDRNITLNSDSGYNWKVEVNEENQTFQILREQ